MTASLTSADRSTVRVSLAVWPRDSYDQRTVRRALEVTLDRPDKRAVRNASGMFVFTELAPDRYTLSVVDRGPAPLWYLPRTVEVNVASLPPLEPLVTLDLDPAPSYPYAPADALARGQTRTFDDVPLAGVRVSAPAFAIATSSADNGEFAFRIRPQQSPTNVAVRFEHGGVVRFRQAELNEGQTTNIGTIRFPDVP